MIGEMLVFTEYIMVLFDIAPNISKLISVQWKPKPSMPDVEVFVKECRILPVEIDIMGVRGGYHLERVQDLVPKFKIWREERLPGVRAFQSTYDR